MLRFIITTFKYIIYKKRDSLTCNFTANLLVQPVNWLI